MSYLLIIFYYFSTAIVDTMDKFLLSSKKIKPLSYTFFTVVTGLVLLVLWPWNYEHLALSRICLDIFSGILFSYAIYNFFKALSEGEVSRVVPFIFALVPLFDILISWLVGRDMLTLKEFAAVALLLPAMLLIIYKDKNFAGKHVALKIFTAGLWSSYYAVWQYAARDGKVLNHLMYNRIGAALPLLLLLLMPAAKSNIFGFKHIEHKKSASYLFLFKQLLGGMNFIYLSFLLVVFKISVVNAMQGFRYGFLFLIAIFFAHYHKHVLQEEINKKVIWQKSGAIALILLGTLILFF